MWNVVGCEFTANISENNLHNNDITYNHTLGNYVRNINKSK